MSGHLSLCLQIQAESFPANSEHRPLERESYSSGKVRENVHGLC